MEEEIGGVRVLDRGWERERERDIEGEEGIERERDIEGEEG